MSATDPISLTLPSRLGAIVGLALLASACSSGSSVCVDYALYSDTRPAGRMVMPEGLSVQDRNGSREVPGVGSDYVFVPQTRCMAEPPIPDRGEPIADAAMDSEGAMLPAAQPVAADAMLGGSDGALVTVYTWASRWAAGDLAGYQALYADGFVLPRGADQATWDRVIANRVQASGPRSVDVVSPAVRAIAPERAEIRFRVVERRAGGASSELSMRMVLVIQDGAWRILEEEAGPG